MDISKVQSVAIYPAIGIARIGNSNAPDGYFLGPSIPGQHAKDDNHFRDNDGNIKRQAARFFVFGLDADGKIIGELNESNGTAIDWRVDVANKKSAWYQFDIALDIPTADGTYDMSGNPTPNGLPVLCSRRNHDIKEKDRKKLMIEARAHHITGTNTNADGEKYHFKGTIGGLNGHPEKEVYLGEVRTDEAGRLLFLGGKGVSESFNGSPQTTFANNEGWYDDTSDGPVDAEITLSDGRSLKATGAWVVTAPPNYAVGVQAFSTGYDLLEDVAARKHPQLCKSQPEFYADLLPVFQYLSQNQWVNAGISQAFGWGSAYDFEHPEVIAKLKDNSEANRPFRQTIFQAFRNPDYQKMEPEAWPPLYGDAVTFNIKSTNPRNWFALTELKYGYLTQWAKGAFTVGEPRHSKTWDNMTPAEQANGLTEAALEETLGGPFHPGCEFTWPMRHAIMYHDDLPFRIKRRGDSQEDFGVALNNEIALSKGGPLDGSSPGDITKWMAVPWQTDTSSCLSAYRTYAGEYLPTFWPARVPNDVLTEADYAILSDPNSSEEDKIAAFSPDRRKKWLRGFIYDNAGNVYNRPKTVGTQEFTDYWYEIGIILKRKLTDNSPLFPQEVWVETGRSYQKDAVQVVERGALASSTPSEPPSRPSWVDENPRSSR